MTRRLHGMLLLVVLLLTGCSATGPAAIPGAGEAATGDPGRQVLVVFTDRALRRAPSGSPGGYLRRGAEYGTTAWSHALGEDIAARHRLRAITEWPILTLGVHCVVYAVEDARSVDEVLRELRGDASVDSAQPMGTFHVLAGDPYEDLQHANRSMNVARAHRAATGRGIRIALVDTGVDFNHPDLAGRIAAHADLTGMEHAAAFDNDIHGTAVAGVIAAEAGNGQGIAGVAPDARLFAYRACRPLREGEPQASCSTLSLAIALDSAIRARPHIINLSLSGPPDPLLEALLSEALARGILVVAAQPPTGSAAQALAGDLDAVIRVRASEQPVADAASHGTVVIPAPGRDILTTFPHGTYNYVSGSSFAAANVTGLLALMLQRKPGLDAASLREALVAALIRDRDSGAVAGIDAVTALDHAGNFASR